MKNGKMPDVGHDPKNGSTPELGRSLQSGSKSEPDVIKMTLLPTDTGRNLNHESTPDLGFNPQSGSTSAQDVVRKTSLSADVGNKSQVSSYSPTNFLRESSSKVSDVRLERQDVTSAATQDALRMSLDPLHHTRGMSALLGTSDGDSIQKSSPETSNLKKIDRDVKRRESLSSDGTQRLNNMWDDQAGISAASKNRDLRGLSAEFGVDSIPERPAKALWRPVSDMWDDQIGISSASKNRDLRDLSTTFGVDSTEGSSSKALWRPDRGMWRDQDGLYAARETKSLRGLSTGFGAEGSHPEVLWRPEATDRNGILIATEISSGGVHGEITPYDQLLKVKELMESMLETLPEEHSQTLVAALRENTVMENVNKITKWAFSHPDANISELQTMRDCATEITKSLDKALKELRPNEADDKEKAWGAAVELAMRRAFQTVAGGVAFTLGTAAVNNILTSLVAKQWLWSTYAGTFAAGYGALLAAKAFSNSKLKINDGNLMPYVFAIQTATGQAITIGIYLASKKGL